MAGSENFYRDLPPAHSFAQVGDFARYRPAPDDWTVFVGIIDGAAAAIDAGQCTAVNMAGAAVITAVLHASNGHEIPFMVVGDRATLIVPDAAREKAGAALRSLQAHSKELFGLGLKAGAITVGALRAGDHDVRVMKLQLSDNNAIAMFGGSGVRHADNWIRSAPPGSPILVEPAARAPIPDLEGLSCRWQPLAAQNGVVVSIVTASAIKAADSDRQHFYDVTQALNAILGAPLELSSPVSDASLRFQWPPAGLELETRATAGRKPRLLRRMEILNQSLIQWALERSKGRIGYYDCMKYHEELRHNVDFQKCDGMLRLVLDVTPEQATRIDAYLHEAYATGRLYYGLHASREALMTCIVFSLKESRHIHFVDGADGGSLRATSALKAQMAGWSSTAARFA